MTVKGFYLLGQDKSVYHQDIQIDQCHDFASLQITIAEHYNIIQSTGNTYVIHSSQSLAWTSAKF